MKYVKLVGSFLKKIHQFLKWMKDKHHHRIAWGLAILFAFLAASFVPFLMKNPPKMLESISTINDGIDPKTDPSTDFDLFIPKIEVSAPVIADVNIYSQKEYNAALRTGVAHAKGNAKPGEIGNIFIFGHSTDWQLYEGKYKTIFKNLPDLKTNDLITIRYKGAIYKYKIFLREVTAYDDTSWIKNTDDKIITLMTCYPIGSNTKRLIIRGRQIE